MLPEFYYTQKISSTIHTPDWQRSCSLTTAAVVCIYTLPFPVNSSPTSASNADFINKATSDFEVQATQFL